MAVAHYTNLCIGGQVGEDYYERSLDLYVLSLLAGVCLPPNRRSEMQA